MELRVIAPDDDLKEQDIDRIERDLDKIDRRLESYDLVRADLRISENGGPGREVTLDLHYGRKHLIAKTQHDKIGQAVRLVRAAFLRQATNPSRGANTSSTKALC